MEDGRKSYLCDTGIILSIEKKHKTPGHIEGEVLDRSPKLMENSSKVEGSVTPAQVQIDTCKSNRCKGVCSSNRSRKNWGSTKIVIRIKPSNNSNPSNLSPSPGPNTHHHSRPWDQPTFEAAQRSGSVLKMRIFVVGPGGLDHHQTHGKVMGEVSKSIRKYGKSWKTPLRVVTTEVPACFRFGPFFEAWFFKKLTESSKTSQIHPDRIISLRGAVWSFHKPHASAPATKMDFKPVSVLEMSIFPISISVWIIDKWTFQNKGQFKKWIQ